jgi:DNA replication protein DnaC
VSTDDPKPLGGALGSLMRKVEAEYAAGASAFDAPPLVRDDAVDWARRDAEVKRVKMLERGWPTRAVDVAMVADVKHSAVSQLAAWDLERNVAVLSGSAGSGKTVGAAHWAFGRRERIEFVRASTFAASSRYNQETRERWYGAAGLCLDDLGAEYLDAKGSFLVDLDELVDTFYADRRPLIITTNCTKQAFKDRYGERVVDRLRESAVWFTVAGASLRGAL